MLVESDLRRCGRAKQRQAGGGAPVRGGHGWSWARSPLWLAAVVIDMRQPTMPREDTSMTNTTYTKLA
jgi:hypothetical protein